ncbi:MAG: hypothetical protein ABW110_18320, partial [Steroidobacteraceae bacterium]
MSEPAIYLPLEENHARASAMRAFADYCGHEARQEFADYLALQRWAVANTGYFWQLFLRWTGLPVEGSDSPPLSEGDCESARFFPNIQLNYARCLLRSLEGDTTPA